MLEPQSTSKSLLLSSLFRYLINVRVIAVILANIWWNQIKILIRTRVEYDRELFNYEEYRKKGMNDQRLIKNTLFMPSQPKGCKTLVGEFFKFQSQNTEAIAQDSTDLNTSEKLVHNLNLLAMHAENLKFIEISVDIEPILRKLISDTNLYKLNLNFVYIFSGLFSKDGFLEAKQGRPL